MSNLKKLLSGLFGKPKKNDNTPPQVKKPLPINNKLMGILLKELSRSHEGAGFSQGYQAVVDSRGFSIVAQAVGKTVHPNAVVLQINFLTTHAVFFPGGIEERLIGVGTDDLEAAKNGVSSFCNGKLHAILRAVLAEEGTDYDFVVKNSFGVEEKWHTIMGVLQVQGELKSETDTLDTDVFLKIYAPFLQSLCASGNSWFHWIRTYVAKMPQNDITGDCYVDNDAWEEGLGLLQAYAASWQYPGKFAGMKQFIIFRRCAGNC